MPRKKLPPKPVEPSISIFDRIDYSRFDPVTGKPSAQNTGYLGIYGQNSIKEICDKHNIPHGELRAQLFHALEFQAVQYRYLSERGRSKATIPQIRGELRDLIKILERATLQIERLHPSTMQRLLMAEKTFLMPPPEQTLRPLIEIGAAWQTGSDEWKVMQFDDAVPHLKLYALVARTAISMLPKSKKGKPTNTPLYAWVSSMAQFWTNTLKRRFTIDTEHGQGLTPSYGFLADCLRPLAPEQVDHLASMMRRVRSDMNRPPKGSG